MRGDAAPVQKNDSQDRPARPEKRAPGGGFSRAMRAEENRGLKIRPGAAILEAVKTNAEGASGMRIEQFVMAYQVEQDRLGSLTVVNRRRGRKGLCGLIFFVKFENNACSMG